MRDEVKQTATATTNKTAKSTCNFFSVLSSQRQGKWRMSMQHRCWASTVLDWERILLLGTVKVLKQREFRITHTVWNPWDSKPKGWPLWGLAPECHLPTILFHHESFLKAKLSPLHLTLSLNGKNLKSLQQQQNGHPSCHFLPLSF